MPLLLVVVVVQAHQTDATDADTLWKSLLMKTGKSYLEEEHVGVLHSLRVTESVFHCGFAYETVVLALPKQELIAQRF